MNEVLRRAMYDAGFTELDLSVELDVDPKTVRNWMRGQLPHPQRRASLATLLNIDEDIVWPALRAAKRLSERPSDLAGVFPRADLLTLRDWFMFFNGARTQIDVAALVPSALLDDPQVTKVIAQKCLEGVRTRLVVVAADSRTTVREDWSSTLVAAVSLLEPLLELEYFELRLHGDAVYNSLFRVDNQFLVNQYAHGLPLEQAPLFHYRRTEDDEIFDAYVASFEVIWSSATVVPRDGKAVSSR